MAIGSKKARKPRTLMIHRFFVRILVPRGPHWGARWPLGAVLGRSWGLLEHLGKHIERSCATQSHLGGHLALSEALLEPSLATLDAPTTRDHPVQVQAR
eukprot:6497610-Pyramimonas_sp.AAC.1